MIAKLSITVSIDYENGFSQRSIDHDTKINNIEWLDRRCGGGRLGKWANGFPWTFCRKCRDWTKNDEKYLDYWSRILQIWFIKEPNVTSNGKGADHWKRIQWGLTLYHAKIQYDWRRTLRVNTMRISSNSLTVSGVSTHAGFEYLIILSLFSVKSINLQKTQRKRLFDSMLGLR